MCVGWLEAVKQAGRERQILVGTQHCNTCVSDVLEAVKQEERERKNMGCAQRSTTCCHVLEVLK